MSALLLFSALISLALSSCICDSQNEPLWVSYGRASAVFQGTVWKANTTSMEVLISRIYKDDAGHRQTGSFVTIHYDCGTLFQSSSPKPTVFFVSNSVAIGHVVTRLMGCKDPALLTSDDKLRLQTGSWNCQNTAHNIDCNTCNCNSLGHVTCSNRTCSPSNAPCMAPNGGDQIPDGTTVFFSDNCISCSCKNGLLSPCKRVAGCVVKNDATPSPSYSRSKPLSISLTSVIFILLLGVIVVVLIRRRMARKIKQQDIVLEDVTNDTNTNTPNYNVATYPTSTNGGYPAPTFPAAYATCNPYSYAPGPGWNGQSMTTVPVVMMTQTGEPVVTQIAYV